MCPYTWLYRITISSSAWLYRNSNEVYIISVLPLYDSNKLVMTCISCASNIMVITTILYAPVYIVVQDDHFLISTIILQLQCILYNIMLYHCNILMRKGSFRELSWRNKRQLSYTGNIIIITTKLYVSVYMIIQDDHFLISMIIYQLQWILYNINIVAIWFERAGEEMIIFCNYYR